MQNVQKIKKKSCCTSDDCEEQKKYALLYNHLECLKKARLNGCEWTEDVCDEAAVNLKKEILLYAHSHGCPWDFCTCWENKNISVEQCIKNGLYKMHILPTLGA